MTSERSTFRASDLIRSAALGLRSRKLRAVLSAAAVAIGIAAVVGVLGITRSSESALLAEIDAAAAEPLVAGAAAALRSALKDAAAADGIAAQQQARMLAGQIAITLQAALLARHAPAPVAGAYCATRLGAGQGAAQAAGPARPFGSLPPSQDTAAILERSAVAVTK